MKPNLENLKEYTSKLSLTSEEKFDMFQNIRAYSNANPVRSRYSLFMKYSVAYATMFALLIGTGATSFAAENALPGDTLYPIKTNVNEEVVKTFAFSDTQKAKFAVTRIDKRMEELEKMIVKEVDSPAKIDVIVAKLEEHKEDLQDFADQVEITNTEEVQEATEIYATLDSVLDTHIDILEEIQESENVVLATNVAPDTIVTQTTSSDTSEDPDRAVVLTMRAINEPDFSTSTQDTQMLRTTAVEESTTTKEQDTLTEVLNFSQGFESLMKDNQPQVDQDTEHTKKIKSDTRKKIIENAKQELQIEVPEETTIQIQTIIQ